MHVFSANIMVGGATYSVYTETAKWDIFNFFCEDVRSGTLPTQTEAQTIDDDSNFPNT